MSVVYLGSLRLDQALPGLRDSLDTVGVALNTLRDTVDQQLALLASPLDAIDGAAGELEGLKDDLVLGQVATLNAQVDSAQAYLGTLGGVSDASAFFAATLASIDAGRAVIAALTPSAYLAQQIAGVTAGVDSLQAQANGVVAMADGATDVSALTTSQTAAIRIIGAAISAASAAAVSGTVAYAEQVSQFLSAAGIHAFWASGVQLSSLGSELSAAVPGTGLSGSTLVAGPILVVDAGNTAAVAALEDVFGT